MDFSRKTIFVSSVLVFLGAIYALAEEESPRPFQHCSVFSGECGAEIRKRENVPSQIELEVSCVCKYRRDVSGNLTDLNKILCPRIPNKSEDPKLDHTILRLENCDVQNTTFPLNILRVLRRSKSFTINVRDAGTLRLPSDDLKEEETRPNIDAKFTNSYLTGLGPGWFSSSSNVSLQMNNCTIGVIEPGFISNYEAGSSADIKMEHTEIQLIRKFAFVLPEDGRLTMQGGKVKQFETLSIEGGKSVTLEGMKLENIQSAAVDIYGMESFILDASIIGKMEKNALMEKGVQGRKMDDPESKSKVKEVSISGNKFMNLDGDAFAGLCREEKLIFENNFISDLSSAPTLKSAHCSTKRDWMNTVKNNGFFCNNCRKMLSGMSEQICAVYKTGWCTCNDESPNNSSILIRGPKGDVEPCRLSFSDGIQQKCEGGEEFMSLCGTNPEDSSKFSEFTGRSFSAAGSIKNHLECSIFVAILTASRLIAFGKLIFP